PNTKHRQIHLKHAFDDGSEVPKQREPKYTVQGGSNHSPTFSINLNQENRDYLEYCNSNNEFSML
ncbi:unnamed protein product, partial [marine sediment metagenome]